MTVLSYFPLSFSSKDCRYCFVFVFFPLTFVWMGKAVILHPSALIPALLGDGTDWRTAVYFVRARVGGALVLCCSGGQLITQVWGLVTGHHHPALCCCQEPFTPSSSSPNGTSESIKTIITANPTESGEIILACRSKHGWRVWTYLSGDLLDMLLAGQPITVSAFCICLVWIHRWLRRSFLRARTASLARWALVWLETEIYDCLVLDGVQTLSTTVFLLPPRLNEPLSTSTQYLLSEDLHCVSKRSIAGQCVFERLSALLQDS